MSVLGSFSDETFEKYQSLVVEREGVDFAEGDTYDFTRCVRPDGSAYGTRGTCKSGKQEEKEVAQLRDQKPHKPPAGWKPYGGEIGRAHV